MTFRAIILYPSAAVAQFHTGLFLRSQNLLLVKFLHPISLNLDCKNQWKLFTSSSLVTFSDFIFLKAFSYLYWIFPLVWLCVVNIQNCSETANKVNYENLLILTSLYKLSFFGCILIQQDNLYFLLFCAGSQSVNLSCIQKDSAERLDS